MNIILGINNVIQNFDKYAIQVGVEKILKERIQSTLLNFEK